MNHHVIRVLSILVVSAGLVSPAIGACMSPQEESPPPQFTSTAKVEVVNVDVLVTDRRDQPVTGLQAEDFELLVDGELVTLTNFLAAQKTAILQPESDAADAGTLDSGRPSYLVIYVDNRGGSPLARDEALREIGAQLPAFVAGGRHVMLVSHGASIQIFHSLSDDPEELPSHLVELAGTTAIGSSLAAERNAILTAIDRTSFFVEEEQTIDDDNLVENLAVNTLQNEARNLLQASRNYADNVLQDQRSRLAAFTQFQSSLAGLPGNKALFYIGEGFASRPGEALFRTWEKRYPNLAEENFFSADREGTRYQIDQELDELVSQANASGVTCYTLYTAGASRFSTMSAQGSGSAGSSTDAASLDRRASEDSLGFIALTTGGIALFPSGEMATAIARVPPLLEEHYSLGFRPGAQNDSSQHRIEVKVVGEGLTVRHRKFYRFKTADEKMAELTYAALLFEPGPNPLEASLAPKEIVATGEEGFEVLVALTVPLANLALVPSRGTHVGRIKVWFGVKDGRGATSTVQTQSFPVTIPNASLLTALGQTATFAWKLKSKEGVYDMVVLMKDDLAEVHSTTTTQFTVPSAAN